MEEKAQKRFEHILSLAAGDETYQQLLRHCGLWRSPVRGFEWVHRKAAGLLRQALNR